MTMDYPKAIFCSIYVCIITQCIRLVTVDKIQPSTKQDVKTRYGITIAFLLKRNFFLCKVFESLVILVKNRLTLWETNENDYGYKTQGKNTLNLM